MLKISLCLKNFKDKKKKNLKYETKNSINYNDDDDEEIQHKGIKFFIDKLKFNYIKSIKLIVYYSQKN